MIREAHQPPLTVTHRRAPAADRRNEAADTGPATAAHERELSLAMIDNSPYRIREAIDDLEGLRDTLLSHGLLQAVVVRPLPGGRYELIAGHRRCAGARLAGWQTIRALVLEADDSTARELVIIADLQHKDLSAIEEARGYEAMLTGANAPTQAGLAARLGISQGQISNRLRLLKLPEPFQRAVISHEITPSVARDLVGAKDLPAVAAAVLARHEEAKRRDSQAEMTDAIKYVLDRVQSGASTAKRSKQPKQSPGPSSIPHPSDSAALAVRTMKDWADSTLLTVARAIAKELQERGLIKNFNVG